MVIRVIPSEEVLKEGRWLSGILVLSIIFFLITLLCYFFIIGFIGKTEKNIENLKTKFSAQTDEEKRLQESMLDYQQKIKDFTSLLQKHKKSSNFFEILEDITHPRVWFSSFKLDSRARIINLEGQSENFQVLSQQLKLFQENSYFQEVNLQDVSLAEAGKVKFKLLIFIDPKILTK